MIKKLIVISAVCGTMLGAVAVTDYFVDDIDIIGFMMNITDDKPKTSDTEFTNNNITSFKPIEIEGTIGVSKPDKYLTYDVDTYMSLLLGNDSILVPYPETEIRTTYSDTAYALNGTFYMVLYDSNHIPNIDNITKKEHRLGRGEPIVLEYTFPKTSTVLYIQCYSENAYKFFNGIEESSIIDFKSKIDLSKSDDDIASKVIIDKSIISNASNAFLDESYMNIINSYNDPNEWSSSFIVSDNKVFNYYRAVGFLDTHMKVEYAKLTQMGYTPLEYGSYNGVSYIKFKELVLLGYSVTNNSCLLYHVTDL